MKDANGLTVKVGDFIVGRNENKDLLSGPVTFVDDKRNLVIIGAYQPVPSSSHAGEFILAAEFAVKKTGKPPEVPPVTPGPKK